MQFPHPGTHGFAPVIGAVKGTTLVNTVCISSPSLVGVVELDELKIVESIEMRNSYFEALTKKEENFL